MSYKANNSRHAKWHIHQKQRIFLIFGDITNSSWLFGHPIIRSIKCNFRAQARRQKKDDDVLQHFIWQLYDLLFTTAQ